MQLHVYALSIISKIQLLFLSIPSQTLRHGKPMKNPAHDVIVVYFKLWYQAR